ncbi:MAG: hypothetical protein BWK76_24040 [Desulfobulbaceae bacterium A2]|nr:MAG: hypothetical protein BWK76_24040 [Desulfobulbaceae bacterium A2]
MKRFLLPIALLLPLAAVALSAERFDGAREVIGILPMQEVFGAEPCAVFEAQDVDLFETPNSSHSIGRISVARPWAFPPSGGCEGLEVAVAIYGPVHRKETLPTLEFSYENQGVIVRKRQGQWFEIALSEGYAWVHIQDADSRYLPVEQLLKHSLTYLSGQGSLDLVEIPGRGKPVWSRSPNIRSKLPVEVVAFSEIAGHLWVQVRILETDSCSEERTGVVSVTGWMPFYDADGMPQIWFYSRGC